MDHQVSPNLIMRNHCQQTTGMNDRISRYQIYDSIIATLLKMLLNQDVFESSYQIKESFISYRKDLWASAASASKSGVWFGIRRMWLT